MMYQGCKSFFRVLSCYLSYPYNSCFHLICLHLRCGKRVPCKGSFVSQPFLPRHYPLSSVLHNDPTSYFPFDSLALLSLVDHTTPVFGEEKIGSPELLHHNHVKRAKASDPEEVLLSSLIDFQDLAFCSDNSICLPFCGISGLNTFSYCFWPAFLFVYA